LPNEPVVAAPCRDVAVKASQIRQLEEEVRLQANAHSARMSDMQATFQQKIADMRQSHAEQTQRVKDSAQKEKVLL
jgi:hypothetical protein